MRLGPWGFKGVMTQVLHHLNKNKNIYVYISILIHVFYGRFERRSKKEERRRLNPHLGLA
jgi:hypothetical protein